MRYIFLLFLISSCGSKRKYIDVFNKPSQTEFDQYRRVIKPDGRENKKRYLYYNSLQFKGKHKRD